MKYIIVSRNVPITLVGGGFLGPNDLSEAQEHGADIVSADGGASAVVKAGLVPQAVIGDFDSLDDKTRAAIPADRLHHIAEQDSTDFDKSLRHIAAPLVLGVGFLGARVDHQMAALNVLVRHAARRVILLGEHEVIWHLPRQIALPLTAGDTVSLMPFAPVTGRSEGLFWPIDGLAMTPGGRIGTSNRAEGPVRLTCDGPGMIGFIPRARLGLLVSALLDLPQSALWPVPG